jgi:glycosyltransferase 2 family protein
VKSKILTGLKIVVSLGLIAYLLTKVDVATVGAAVRSANYAYHAVALLLYAGAVTSGGLKWYVLLRAQGIDVPFTAILAYTFEGVFFNNFLPANVGGDVMRGYGLAKHTDRVAEAAVSVVVDRIVGLIAFMSAAFVCAVVVVFFTGQRQLMGAVLASGLGMAALASLFAAVLSRHVRALVERLFRNRWLARLAPVYGRLSDALSAYRFKFGRLVLAFCVSLGTLILSNVANYMVVQALGGGISLLHIFLFNPLIAFVLLIPVSVGGLGLNQGAFVFFYGLVGVRQEVALPVSLVMQIIIYITSLPGGVLWWRGRQHAAPAPGPQQA